MKIRTYNNVCEPTLKGAGTDVPAPFEVQDKMNV